METWTQRRGATGRVPPPRCSRDLAAAQAGFLGSASVVANKADPT